jgi:hypothetical protein
MSQRLVSFFAVFFVILIGFTTAIYISGGYLSDQSHNWGFALVARTLRASPRARWRRLRRDVESWRGAQSRGRVTLTSTSTSTSSVSSVQPRAVPRTERAPA